MKKLTVILMVLALVLTSVFAQGAAEGTATTEKKGSVYWLNFKPESDAVLQEVAKAYTAETGVEVKVVLQLLLVHTTKLSQLRWTSPTLLHSLL